MRCVLTSPPFPAELALPAGAQRTAQLSSTGRRLAVLMTATALSAGLVQAQEGGNAGDKSNAASPADMALLRKPVTRAISPTLRRQGTPRC